MISDRKKSNYLAPRNVQSGLSNTSTNTYTSDVGNVPTWNNQVPLNTNKPFKKKFFDGLPNASNAKGYSNMLRNGQNKTNITITYPTITTPWDDEKYHQQQFEGQFVMAFAGDPGDGTTLQLTVRQVNQEFRNHYREADRIFKSGLKNGIDETSFEKEHLKQLSSMSTKCWQKINFFRKELNSKSGSIANFRFLYEEGCGDLWSPYGVVQGQASDDTSAKQIAIARYGMVEVFENIWGRNAKPGTKLYLIFKRVRHQDGSYGAFQYVPYASESDPPMAMRTYRDYSGHLRIGRTQIVGEVIWWRSSANKQEYNLLEDAGLVDPSPNRVFNRSAAAELRIALVTKRGSKHKDLFC